MDLSIYLACQEQFCHPDETGVVVRWGTPDRNELVSMGAGKTWKVVEQVQYEASQDICPRIVYVHPDALEIPSRSEWDSASESDTTIQIALDEVGKPELEFGFNMLGQAPVVGDRLMNYEATEHPTWMQPVATDWVIDSFDEFLPQTQSFYKAIYIAWCKAERFAIAA
ncbi:hypothetical protein NIES2135_26890 [Leptolyngbya boryana NIES-2135]|jgi:hypothetical protein|uniref:Uncharacterized protein n=2 Tax=Leptolyngbya group TaxID=3081713 RepID=A0A1Z4JGH7_LEPBY|nr:MULTISPECIES: hypothetical protein [Leptolyngbya]BAY55864.1 hypothetical protein NIES2135_26890 [Leptolyngbya boryana NIES-2135]MBD2368828.1 hypothetical protein [Leptolyngbya sp. FACHB-161]MBD2375304.1 hypothetical protein [Leptolyngbya sp. FACHB-238]MBD2399722.1 hypothetical protein [Leptolyngbya sp. FACHB-239]MBD2405928.1 hypothetical protein [Leptolyngbya sp. FACHB-402]